MGRPVKPGIKERLLHAGVDLLHARAFSACGVQDIADAAVVPKGSFYNHFDSKDAFAAAIVVRYWDTGEKRLRAALAAETLTPGARLVSYFRRTAERVRAHDFGRGCLLGNMSLELADHSPLVREHLRTAFGRWALLLADGIRAAQDAGEIDGRVDPNSAASFLISAFEGAILRARVERSEAPFELFFDFALAALFRRRPSLLQEKRHE